jgi:hypothetical protein
MYFLSCGRRCSQASLWPLFYLIKFASLKLFTWSWDVIEISFNLQIFGCSAESSYTMQGILMKYAVNQNHPLYLHNLYSIFIFKASLERVTIDVVWIGNQIYWTELQSVTVTSRCLVVASNGGHSPCSGFMNCPQPQLPTSHSNSSQQLNLSGYLNYSFTNSPTDWPTTCRLSLD